MDGGDPLADTCEGWYRMWSFFEEGGILMVPLLLCSLVSVTVIFERIYFWVRFSYRHRDEILEEFFAAVGEGGTPRLGTKAQPGELACSDARVEILMEALQSASNDLQSSLRLGILERIETMKRGMTVLDTIITMAPLLGILGTVVGIIASFEAIGMEGSPAPKMVSMGIAQALVTTAAGLVIAIGTLVPYNYFHSRVSGFMCEMERLSSRLLLAAKGSGEETDVA
jgi:biopolymer transport protein ExbB